MFGIGMTEIIVILVIALLLIGPDKLPGLAKTLGKGLFEFKRATEDFRDSVQVDLKNDSHKKQVYLSEHDTAAAENTEEEKEREGDSEKENTNNGDEKDNKVA